MSAENDKKNEDGFDEADMEGILMTSDQGITLIKSLEEFMEQKQIILGTDIINLILSVSIFFIYGARTYLMCKFDSDPIWRLPATSS